MLTFIQRITGARPEEVPALAWSLLYVIAIFLAYYVLRPIRDELGVAGGVDNLPWLFTGTLLTMLTASPLFAYAVRRFPRERFIPISYRFFGANLVGFAVLLAVASPDQQVWIGRAFFIWVSVFNLFVVSIFWSFIVDIFNGEQGKRLFGIVAAGATLGGLVGSALTSGLIEHLGRTWLLVISVLLIEVAVLASARLSRVSETLEKPIETENPHKPLGGGDYGVTKAALNALTVRLSKELPSAVKVNAMCPGWVRTRMGGTGRNANARRGSGHCRLACHTAGRRSHHPEKIYKKPGYKM